MFSVSQSPVCIYYTNIQNTHMCVHVFKWMLMSLTIVCANVKVYKASEHLSGPPKKFSILKTEKYIN